LRLNPLFVHFASALHAPGQHHALVKDHFDADACHLSVVNQPLPTKAAAWHQQALASNLANVQRHGVAGLRFAAEAALPPTSTSSHFYSPVFAEINWQVEQVL
jgi:hypothetical protein